MKLLDEVKSELAKIPISIDSVDKALAFAQELGLLPPGAALAGKEAIDVIDKTVNALKKVGAITDEASADKDLAQLRIDLAGDEAEAEKAIAGDDPQDPPTA